MRLVGDNVEIGVYKIKDALAIAEEQGLDLVEISPKAIPPVCKVMEYKKFLYEQKKREKVLKPKQQKLLLRKFVLVLKQMTMITNLKRNMLLSS